MKPCHLVILLVTSLCALTVISESQFEHDRWEAVGGSVDFSCQSQLIQKYQPAIRMSWTKDKTEVDHTSLRYRLDAGGNLHISDIQPEDAGTYCCLINYWETTLTSNQVTLHVGMQSAEGGGEERKLFGVPLPWLISLVASLVLLLVWIMMIIVTSCCRTKSENTEIAYAEVPDDEDEDDVEVENGDDDYASFAEEDEV
ncbi:uncharacterized protein [Diadema setosum]|uniref:uncharacterized protein n=1 Tax=Diadema setosum TaxID=31175 RepID=UPI003B3A80D1